MRYLRDRVPPLRATRGPAVVTAAKLALLGRVGRGDHVGARSSWVMRVLVADGLVAADPLGFAVLTPNGELAVERGRLGPMTLRRWSRGEVLLGGRPVREITAMVETIGEDARDYELPRTVRFEVVVANERHPVSGGIQE